MNRIAASRFSVLARLCLLSSVLGLAFGQVVAAADLENGEEINEVCGGCHGPLGQGGKQGEYPRLAGQPKDFIAYQLHLFRDRKRPNMAMIEYIDERQMPDEDIEDISAYLAAIDLPSKLAPVDVDASDFNAYERLLETERIVQIPRAEGDIENGHKIYRKECASCHGRDGKGDDEKAVPMLTGQYTNYLWRQVDKFLKGIRIHDLDEPDEELLADFSRDEIRDIFAWASVADD